MKIEAPHLTGFWLKFFVKLLESPLIGSLIMSHLKKENKMIEILRNTVIPEAPMFKPEFPPQDEINKSKKQRDQGLNDKTDEQIIPEVLGKDTHGYLKAYGPGRSITQHFKVNPSRLDLSQEVNEVKKKADQIIEEARKDAENTRTEAEKAKIEAEQAKKEAETIRNDVDKKTADNIEVWEKKFSQLLDYLGAGGSSNNDDSGSEGSSQ